MPTGRRGGQGEEDGLPRGGEAPADAEAAGAAQRARWHGDGRDAVVAWPASVRPFEFCCGALHIP